jgi:hypothetical protein
MPSNTVHASVASSVLASPQSPGDLDCPLMLGLQGPPRLRPNEFREQSRSTWRPRRRHSTPCASTSSSSVRMLSAGRSRRGRTGAPLWCPRRSLDGRADGKSVQIAKADAGGRTPDRFITSLAFASELPRSGHVWGYVEGDQRPPAFRPAFGPKPGPRGWPPHSVSRISKRCRKPAEAARLRIAARAAAPLCWCR